MDRLILTLYFPQFSRPSCSRFSSFLKNLKKKYKEQINTDTSLIIYPEKIIQNIDRRTTIVIKNVPIAWNKKSIRKLIESYGNINYLYIIPNPENKNTAFVYINVVNYKSIVNIYMSLRKLKFNIEQNDVIIEIVYSHIQGKNQLIQQINENGKIFDNSE